MHNVCDECRVNLFPGANMSFMTKLFPSALPALLSFGSRAIDTLARRESIRQLLAIAN